MSNGTLLIFLWGTLFGYLWANYYMAKLLYKLGYRSIKEIPYKDI